MNIMFFLKPKSELAYIYDYHTLRQAMEIMEYHKYSCVPILNKEGKYVGSITEGDVLWALKKLDIFYKGSRRYQYYEDQTPCRLSVCNC